MAEADDRARIRSYLAAQSAKLSAADLCQRLEEAAAEFFAVVECGTDAIARQVPAEGQWTLAQIVDHVVMTLDDVTGIMRGLAGGRPPAIPMSSHEPVNAGLALDALVARLRRSHAAATEFLAAQGAEPHVDLHVSEPDFGELNWKGYALILRLHDKDHAQQARATLEALASRR